MSIYYLALIHSKKYYFFAVAWFIGTRPALAHFNLDRQLIQRSEFRMGMAG
ncbi:hypothetical protein [Pontibacter sp. 13R65]|uniref:hypothetical protein n=1 Tax=Pontibacter sp. 13R65 TaxID=3127458 RepID=UPI0039C92776